MLKFLLIFTLFLCSCSTNTRNLGLGLYEKDHKKNKKNHKRKIKKKSIHYKSIDIPFSSIFKQNSNNTVMGKIYYKNKHIGMGVVVDLTRNDTFKDHTKSYILTSLSTLISNNPYYKSYPQRLKNAHFFLNNPKHYTFEFNGKKVRIINYYLNPISLEKEPFGIVILETKKSFALSPQNLNNKISSKSSTPQNNKFWILYNRKDLFENDYTFKHPVSLQFESIKTKGILNVKKISKPFLLNNKIQGSPIINDKNKIICILLAQQKTCSFIDNKILNHIYFSSYYEIIQTR